MKIIAECGCNWDSIDQAKEMIKRSKEVGCWASKFQLFYPKIAPKLPKHLYLTFEQAKELFEYGKSINQIVFFTPMYLKAVDWCEKIGVEYYKIRYKDRYNEKLVNKIRATRKMYFISFDLDDFHTNNPLTTFNEPNIPLLCIPKYPATMEEYGYIITFGYSDHTPDLRLLQLAKGINALYFEKHVKLEGTKPLENDWSVSFTELEKVLK